MTRTRKGGVSLVASFIVAGVIGATIGLSGVASGRSPQAHVSLTDAHHVRPLSSSTSRPESASSSPIPAPTPTVQTIPSSQQLPYVGPPYISQSDAESAALQVANAMGPGAQVLTAELESVAAASEDAGQQVATFSVSSDRMVWLVWLVGTYQPGCISTTCPAWQNELYFVAVDATTGQTYGVGTSTDAPGAPSVPAGVNVGPQDG